MTSKAIPEQDLEKIREVFSRYPFIEQAVLYGSRAKGTHRPGSDIDLTLKGDQLEVHQLTRIMDELDDLLLPYRIDLSLFNHLDQSDLLDHIQRVGKSVYP
jgi:predicted nucleotidyltransferase